MLNQPALTVIVQVGSGHDVVARGVPAPQAHGAVDIPQGKDCSNHCDAERNDMSERQIYFQATHLMRSPREDWKA